MSALRKPAKLTAAEYLAVENAAAFKSEFYDGEMFQMAGASPPHNYVKENIAVELGYRLRGGPCRTASSDQRVSVDRGRLYTYPDIVVTCGPREYDPLDPNTLTNPTLVVEVLSPGTEAYDRGAKLRLYQRVPSLREVVLASQGEMLVEVYTRQPDGGWLHRVFDDPAGELELAGLPMPVRIPLADVYRDTELPERPPLRPATPEADLPGSA